MALLAASDRRAAVARALSYAGLIPFVGGALLAWGASGAWRAAAVEGVVLYAVAILSFIGAIHWGRVLAGEDAEPVGPLWLVWGVLPSLLGWFAALLPRPATVPVLILAFALAWGVDRRAVAEGRYPGWFGSMRTVLTVVVALTLAAVIPLTA